MTGWFNNCGLNVMAHFLFDKLEEGRVTRDYQDHAGYKLLRDVFQQYYALPACPTWEAIHRLLKEVSSIDREAILGPVLRQYLAEIMRQVPGDIWDQFASDAYTEHLKGHVAVDHADAVLAANQDWMDADAARFAQEWAEIIQKEGIVEENARWHRREALLAQYQRAGKAQWIATGSQRYAQYLERLEHHVMIGADEHLGLLGKSLEIAVRTITPNFSMLMKEDNPLPMTCYLYNSGEHWSYIPCVDDPVALDQKVMEHNKHYPESFTEEEYYQSEALSGKFKIYGSPEQAESLERIESIKQYVRQNMPVEKAPMHTAVTVDNDTVSKSRSFMRDICRRVVALMMLPMLLLVAQEEDRHSRCAAFLKACGCCIFIAMAVTKGLVAAVVIGWGFALAVFTLALLYNSVKQRYFPSCNQTTVVTVDTDKTADKTLDNRLSTDKGYFPSQGNINTEQSPTCVENTAATEKRAILNPGSL